MLADDVGGVCLFTTIRTSLFSHPKSSQYCYKADSYLEGPFTCEGEGMK